MGGSDPHVTLIYVTVIIYTYYVFNILYYYLPIYYCCLIGNFKINNNVGKYVPCNGVDKLMK